MHKLILVLFFLIYVVYLKAQETGDDFFDESIVHQIRVNSDDNALLANLLNDHLLNWPDNYEYRSVDLVIDGN